MQGQCAAKGEISQLQLAVPESIILHTAGLHRALLELSFAFVSYILNALNVICGEALHTRLYLIKNISC